MWQVNTTDRFDNGFDSLEDEDRASVIRTAKEYAAHLKTEGMEKRGQNTKKRRQPIKKPTQPHSLFRSFNNRRFQYPARVCARLRG